MNSLVPI